MTGSDRALLTDAERATLREQIEGEDPEQIYKVRSVVKRRVSNLLEDLILLERAGENDILHKIFEGFQDSHALNSPLQSQIRELENRLNRIEDQQEEVEDIRIELEELKRKVGLEQPE